MATPREIVDLLNELYAADASCAHQLVETRVPCNDLVTNHATIICHPEGGRSTVGVLGFLNAVVALDGERIEAMFDDKTMRLTGFRLRRKEVAHAG